MAGNGPAPTPDGQRRRRNAVAAMTQLPAGGRPGPAPVWPLRPDVALVARRDTAQRDVDNAELRLLEPTLTVRQRTAAKKKLDAALTQRNMLQLILDSQDQAEGEVWVQAWATPQAAVWERMGWTREVAQYVRWKVRGEAGDLDAAKEARQLADRLGLTPLAMLRLRWAVVQDQVAEQRATSPRVQSARARMRIVDPNARDAAGGE